MIINIPKSEVLDLREKMKVRPHQVASMMLCDREESRITAFAFDEGEGVSELYYDGDNIYLVTEGELTLTADGKEYRISALDAAFVPAGVPHSVSSSEPFKFIQIRYSKGENFMEKIINNIEHSKVLCLKELVSYEKNQVVSLTLANQPGIGMTLMAFDEGAKIDTHVTPGDAMPNVLEGEAEFTIGEKSYRVKAGESIVMPIGIPHSVKAVTKFKMLLVVVKKGE